MLGNSLTPIVDETATQLFDLIVWVLIGMIICWLIGYIARIVMRDIQDTLPFWIVAGVIGCAALAAFKSL